MGYITNVKQQGQYTLCFQEHFCFHSRWCSEVKGHTCTRLHQEVGSRRQWGEGWQGPMQRGHSMESRQRTISSSVRYSFPPSDRAMMLSLYSPSPVKSTSCQHAGGLRRKHRVSGHRTVYIHTYKDTMQSLRILYAAIPAQLYIWQVEK